MCIVTELERVFDENLDRLETLKFSNPEQFTSEMVSLKKTIFKITKVIFEKTEEVNRLAS